MAYTLVSPQIIIARNAAALYSVELGTANMNSFAALTGTDPNALLNSVYVNSIGASSTSDVADVLITNLGITDAAAVSTAKDYIVGQLNAVPVAQRGGVVNTIISLFSGLVNDSVFGTYAQAWNTAIDNAVVYASATGNPDTKWPGVGVAPVTKYTLTSGTDTATANIFDSNMVYTPGGQQRINTLQDEDQLTGTGDNPTLNAVLGNANDNGGTTITPQKLDGLQTLNFNFTGSSTNAGNSNAGGAVTTIDLQNWVGAGAGASVNIQGVSNNGAANGVVANGAAIIANMPFVPANLSIKGSAAPISQTTFSFTNAGATGTADATTLTMTNLNTWDLNVEAQSGQKGVESITLSSAGAANTIQNFNAQDVKTLKLTGAADLTVDNTLVNIVNGSLVEAVAHRGGLNGLVSGNSGAQLAQTAGGSLTAIDAKDLTGALTLNLGNVMTAVQDGTSGVDTPVKVEAGSGNTTFIINGLGAAGNGATPFVVSANDTITGGAGANTLQLYGVQNTAATGDAGQVLTSVTKVQTLDVRETLGAGVGSAVTVDTSKLPDLTTITIRNEGQAGGNANSAAGAIANAANSASGVEFYNFNKTATTVTANGINVLNGTTGNNAVGQVVLNVNEATASTAGLLKVNVVDAVNADPRYNFTVNATTTNLAAGQTATTWENLTLDTAQSSESGTILVGGFGAVSGTLLIKGGQAGKFLNLDSTANSFRYSQTGSEIDGTANSYTETVAGAAERFTAATIDASTFGGSVTVRVGDPATATNTTGAQTIKMSNAGGNIVIFDAIAGNNANRAGLTSADTVSGGTGANDTLALGGNVAVSIGASEWTNVTGFEKLVLLGDGVGVGPVLPLPAGTAGATNPVTAGQAGYSLTLTNTFLAANGNGNIVILNDSDPTDNAANAASTQTGANGVAGATAINSSAYIDTTGTPGGSNGILSTQGFNYKGAEGLNRTNDRFVFNDNNLTSNITIDGGAVTNSSTLNVGTANAPGQLPFNGNFDVIQMKNNGNVSTDDLRNVKNVGIIEFSNDQSVNQNNNLLTLSSAVVDSMVDSYHTAAATGNNIETLTIRALDNINTTTGLSISSTGFQSFDASTVSNAFGLEALLGRGTNNVIGSAGTDVFVLLGNYTAATYAGDVRGNPAQVINGVVTNWDFGVTLASQANQTAATIAAAGQRAVTDVFSGVANATGILDTLVTYGAINLAGATLGGIGTLVANSDVTLTAAQFQALQAVGAGGLVFNGTGGHTLRITGAATAALDLSKIVVNGGTLTYDVSGVTGGFGTVNAVTTTTVGASVGTATAGTVAVNTTANSGGAGSVGTAIALTAGGTFTGTANVNDNFTGAITALNGTTITGNAGDTETLTLTGNLNVTLGNATTGGTITNMSNLVLDSTVANTAVAFAAGTGFKSITGGTLADTIDTTNMTAGGTINTNAGNDVVTLGANLAGTTINLGSGNDSLVSAVGGAITTTLIGGDGTSDSLTLVTGDNLTNATVTGFETLSITNGATVTFGASSLLQQFTSINATGTNALTINIAAGAHDFTGVTFGSNFDDNTNNHTFNISSGASLTTNGDAQFTTLTAAKQYYTGAGTLITKGALTLAGATDTISNVTFGATGLTITDDGAAARSYIGSTGADTLLTGNAAAAISVNISQGGSDTIKVDSAGTASAAVTITGFQAGATASGGDVLSVSYAAAPATLQHITGLTGNLTASSNTTVANIPNVVALDNAIFQVSGAFSDTAVKNTLINGYVNGNAALGMLTTGFTYVALDNGTDTAIYRIQTTDTGGTNGLLDSTADIVAIQQVVVLTGIADVSTLTSANFA